MRRLSLFVEYFKIYLQMRLMYRLDFWVEVISDFAFQTINLSIILVAFLHTPSILGWSQAELFFVYGFFMVPYAFFTTFFNLWNFAERYIVKGELDRVLTRPAGSLMQLSLENIDPSALVGAVTGGAIMWYASMQLGLEWGWIDLLAFVCSMFGAILIYGGIYVLLISLSFFTDSQTGILPLMWNIQNYGKFPMDIYNKVIRIVLTWIVPFAFVGVYPASFFLRRDDLTAWFTPLVGFVVFGVALFVWQIGIRKYRGAGS